jgi:subtilisin family serine protease
MKLSNNSKGSNCGYIDMVVRKTIAKVNRGLTLDDAVRYSTFLMMFILLTAVNQLSGFAQSNTNSYRAYIRLKPQYIRTELRSLVQFPEAVKVEQALLSEIQSLRYYLMMSLRPAIQDNTSVSTPSGISTQPNQQIMELLALSTERKNEILRTEEVLLRTVSAVIEAQSREEAQKICTWLSTSHPAVETASLCSENKLLYKPNDSQIDSQRYLNTIRAFSAWDITRGNASVLVGVSDSGLLPTHEDLKDAIAVNTAEIPNNNIDDDNNGYIDDYAGYNISYRADKTQPDNVLHPAVDHGAKVSGIIGATQNNGIGISGIAGLCKIVSIKSVPNDESGAKYGYESIIYSAIRGVKVLNCSWGSGDKAPSPIEQSIIDFAVARDVAIVCSAGNGGNSAHDLQDTYYPSGYNGVLGVGETNANDSWVSSTSMGIQTRIMAPGSGALTTGIDSNQDYGDFSGTSSASPMVAGVVALVRSRFPNLTALQALEHTRITARDISASNPGIYNLIPGTVDARKAVETEPFSNPSLRLYSYTMFNTKGEEISNAKVGDTVRFTFKGKNILGSASGATFTLRVIDFNNSTTPIQILDSTATVASINAGADFTAEGFRCVIRSAFPLRLFLRINVDATTSTNNDYVDFSLLEWIPTSEFTTIENDVMLASVSDYGWLGSNLGLGGQQNRSLQGKGFALKNTGRNLIYTGGLVTAHYTSSGNTVVSGIAGNAENGAFGLVNSTSTRQSSSITMNDKNLIGLELKQNLFFFRPDEKILRGEVTVKNTSNKPISNLSVGYYLDWDIVQVGDSQSVRLANEFAPSGNGITSSATEITFRNQNEPFIGASAWSYEQGAVAQAAGFIRGLTSVSDIQLYLNNGTSIQTDGKDDAVMVVGMNFPTAIQPNETRKAYFSFAIGDTREDLGNKLRASVTSVNEGELSSGLRLRVINHAIGGSIAQLSLEGIDNTLSQVSGTISLISMTGEVALLRECTQLSTQQLPTGVGILLSTDGLPSGAYIVRYSNALGDMVATSKVLITK